MNVMHRLKSIASGRTSVSDPTSIAKQPIPGFQWRLLFYYSEFVLAFLKIHNNATGETKGLTRYGIVKDSVISNASFEKTVDHFSDASVQSRVDKIAGVSESIIVGMPVQLGTGMLQLRQRVPPVELTYNVDPIFA